MLVHQQKPIEIQNIQIELMNDIFFESNNYFYFH